MEIWVYACFYSYIAPDKFYIEPRDPHSTRDKVLVVDRVSQDLSLTGKRQGFRFPRRLIFDALHLLGKFLSIGCLISKIE